MATSSKAAVIIAGEYDVQSDLPTSVLSLFHAETGLSLW
jgi:hypothetical protein